jgi:hypothetical protein
MICSASGAQTGAGPAPTHPWQIVNKSARRLDFSPKVGPFSADTLFCRSQAARQVSSASSGPIESGRWIFSARSANSPIYSLPARKPLALLARSRVTTSRTRSLCSSSRNWQVRLGKAADRVSYLIVPPAITLFENRTDRNRTPFIVSRAL